MSHTICVQGYKVHYANDSSMTDKTRLGDGSIPIENPTNTFTITCKNVDLIDNQTYFFTIAAQMTNGSESISNPKEATYVNDMGAILILLH